MVSLTSLLPVAAVPKVSPGTSEISVLVKLPPERRNPWGGESNIPTIWPALLMPLATVKLEPGTSIGVKLAPERRKPCSAVKCSIKDPTIWPVALMPRALDEKAVTGTLSWVKVPPEKRKPCCATQEV